MSKNVNVSFEPDNADDIRRMLFIPPNVPITRDFPGPSRHGWLRLSNNAWLLKTPLDMAIFEYYGHKPLIWNLLGKQPIHEDRTGTRGKEFEDKVLSDNEWARQFADKLKYGQGPSNLNPQAPSYWYWADSWDPNNIANALTFNNILGMFSLREVTPKLKRELFDDRNTQGTIVNIIAHFATTFNVYDIDPAIYGQGTRTQRALSFKDWRFAIVPPTKDDPNGSIQFGSKIVQPMEKVDGLWKPEPIMEYVLGEATHHFWIPEEIYPSLADQQDIGTVITLNSAIGPYLLWDDALLRQKFPDRQSAFPFEVAKTGYTNFSALVKKVADYAKSIGVPIAQFTRNLLYHDDLDYLWKPNLSELPDPILVTLQHFAMANDIMDALANTTHNQMATWFFQELHDRLKRHFDINADIQRPGSYLPAKAPASGYNRYWIPAMIGHGIDCSDLQYDKSLWNVEQDFSGANQIANEPTRYGEHVYAGPQ